MRAPLLALVALALGACSDAGAFVSIEDARVFRVEAGRVALEIDVAAKERLGGNIGIYCVEVTFTGDAEPIEECRSDLEDGDRRTLRFTSQSALGNGAAIDVSVRLDRVGARRTLHAPP